PLRLDLWRSRVGPRLARGDKGVLAGGVVATDLDLRENLVGRGVHRGGERDGELVLLDPVVLEGADSGRAGLDGLPGLLDVASDRAGRAHAGDDDTALGVRGHLLLLGGGGVMVGWCTGGRRLDAMSVCRTPTGLGQAGSALRAADEVDCVLDVDQVLYYLVRDAH